MGPALKGLDDAHAPTAARTRRELGGWFLGPDGFWRGRRYGEPFADAGDVGLSRRAGEQPVVPNAVEAERQNMQQEATHELVGVERHDLMALKTPEGRALYALRRQTPEPVSGIIKSVLGFRQFSLRGLESAQRGEWSLVTMAWSLKRMFALALGY